MSPLLTPAVVKRPPAIVSWRRSRQNIRIPREAAPYAAVITCISAPSWWNGVGVENPDMLPHSLHSLDQAAYQQSPDRHPPTRNNRRV